MEETTELEASWAQLAPAANELSRLATALKGVAKQLSSSEGYESLTKVEKTLAKLDGLEGGPPALLEEARRAGRLVKTWVDGEWIRRASAFRLELEDHFRDRGLTLVADGGDVCAPPITMRIDGPKDKVDLLHAGEPLKTGIPMVPERVFREREAALNRLRKAQTAPDELADRLLAAYDVLGGGRVKILELHFQLFVGRQTKPSKTSLARSKIKEYPRAQLAFDLAGLLAAPHCLQRGERRIELVPAGATAQQSRMTSIRVVAPDGGPAYYAAMQLAR